MGRVAAGVRVEERVRGASDREVRGALPLTPFHQLVAAETLTVRGGPGRSRLAPALAHASLDLNPHQVEAAAFALGTLPTGGAVLADEVGLGKTIEAGLVLAQLASEGRDRAVVLVPASLRNQWRDELRSRFGLAVEVMDGERARALAGNPFDRPGVVIASHAFGALRADELARVPWDLAVIDEAHRLRNAWRRDHRTGQALRRALRRAPKLLLTATPLQNDLMELLGLAAFLDEALLGDEDSFRLQYATGELTEERTADLQARLAPVVVRTLRRQVKEYVRFTARRSMVEDFDPSAEEQALYDRVSDYLRREEAFAIPRARRALLVLVYRKILASSSFALASTLTRLADSLEHLIAGTAAEAEACPELEGFDEEAEEWSEGGTAPPRRTPLGAAPHARRAGRGSRLRARRGRHPREREGGGAVARPRPGLHGGPGLRLAGEGRGLHRVPPDPGLPPGPPPGPRPLGHLPLRRLRVGRPAPGAGGGVPRREPDPAHDRGRRRGAEPPVLQPGGELRPALEPSADRAAHRPLPPLRPGPRRAGGELPEPPERRRRPPLRAARREAPALRRRLRILRRGAGRARQRRRFRAARPRHLPVVPHRRGGRPGLRGASAGPGRAHRGPALCGALAPLRALRRRRPLPHAAVRTGDRGGRGTPRGRRGGAGPVGARRRGQPRAPRPAERTPRPGRAAPGWRGPPPTW